MRAQTNDQLRGQRGKEIAGNDEKYQMKTSQSLCAFSVNTGLRVAEGRDLAQSSGNKKKNSKCKRTDYHSIYRNDQCRQTAWTQQNTLSSGTLTWFFFPSEELCHCNYGLSENSECCCFNHSKDKKGEIHWTSLDVCVCTAERVRAEH